ncbi:hypothetical protein QUF82_09145 [Thiotrichales bacterium HSG14]|nr:hypothetical protein [Thiotrichales bacterium HSG14]
MGCNEGSQKRVEVVDTRSRVYAFLTDMNPELHQAMSKMEEEIALANKKIQQLYELKEMFPDQRNMINKSLKQWQVLRKDLGFTSKNIYVKMEAAYVAYKIDEIQGQKKFSVLSQELLKEANLVLDNAETTKSLIEEELYDK